MLNYDYNMYEPFDNGYGYVTPTATTMLTPNVFPDPQTRMNMTGGANSGFNPFASRPPSFSESENVYYGEQDNNFPQIASRSSQIGNVFYGSMFGRNDYDRQDPYSSHNSRILFEGNRSGNEMYNQTTSMNMDNKDMISKDANKAQPKKLFECHICYKNFTRKENHKVHVKTVHERIRQFECFICHRHFGFQHHLERHMSTTHSSGKEYTCSKCLSTFNEHRFFERHIKVTHQNIKEFKCNKCQAEFGWRSLLKIHYDLAHAIKEERSG